MPQITVNEIDQSVVTRVVVDNRVKILIPAILSFGPYTVINANDVTEFNRKCGYTPAEFNPFVDDKSRIYARELMKRGSAVSIVRVNTGGKTAVFDIDGSGLIGTGRSESDLDVMYLSIPSSVYPSITPKVFGTGDAATDVKTLTNQSITSADSVKKITLSDDEFKVAVASSAHYVCPILPGTLSITIGDKICTDTGVITSAGTASNPENYLTLSYEGKTVGKIRVDGVNAECAVIEFSGADGLAFVGDATSATVSSKLVPTDDLYKYIFAPQIKAIKAKYPGSFGNNLFISISQITTKNLAESYQYANISVYYVDQDINYEWDTNANKAVVKSRVVKNVTRLETKRVSTNPNDPYYFEDVDFEFIEIEAATGAREQLAIVWSNINADPTSPQQYSGFPNIVLKYYVDNYLAYNYNACLSGGTDFAYSDPVLAKLQAGFKGYIPTGSSTWQPSDVTAYNKDVYGDSTAAQPKNGIIKDTYANIISMYSEFSDPYIYDFDFITSGGFVYREFNESGAKTYPESSGNLEYYTGITPIHQAMLNLVEERQDCIALFDVPADYDPDDALTNYSRMLNTSYGTMHFPWCYVNDPDIAQHLILMSPSYVFLYTFLSNLDNNVDSQKWFPPAGVKRATARVVKKPYFEMGSVLLNKWQNDTTARVNPIMRLKQYGYVIYGQYTNLEAIDMYTHSALESLNVRLISNVVKKKIFDVCLNLAFEPNTENLWNKFYAQMDEFLRYMKYNEGVYDYRIVMDESTVTTDDINHLRCPGKVYIAPTRTAEFFDIDFIITEAGAQFTN